MSPPNGHVNGAVEVRDQLQHAEPASFAPRVSAVSLYTQAQIKEFVSLLEIPFEPALIEWRVTNTSKGNGPLRGQVIPYADQRAYTDRLNSLFSPAGWTRKYTVHTSANFQRAKDQKTTAKVFVTCDLTIFGIGSHSATGEEWADDENAGTSAEAQAFKRACSCFGLGRYLYYFAGTWVDLDQRRRPIDIPELPHWATSEGWRQGLRPTTKAQGAAASETPEAKTRCADDSVRSSRPKCHPELVRQIGAMAEPLGKRMYRGFLKALARVWDPGQIDDPAVLQKVLTHMQAAQRGLTRLDAALDKISPEPLGPILDSLGLKSLDQVDNLDLLQKIVLAMETKAAAGPRRT
jgi:hypothetical protein